MTDRQTEVKHFLTMLKTVKKNSQGTDLFNSLDVISSQFSQEPEIQLMK